MLIVLLRGEMFREGGALHHHQLSTSNVSLPPSRRQQQAEQLQKVRDVAQRQAVSLIPAGDQSPGHTEAASLTRLFVDAR